MDDNLILYLALGAIAYFLFIKGNGGGASSGPALTFLIGPEVQMTPDILNQYVSYCSRFGGTANTNNRNCIIPYAVGASKLPAGSTVQDWATNVNGMMMLDPRIKNGTATWDPVTMTYTIHNGWAPWGM